MERGQWRIRGRHKGVKESRKEWEEGGKRKHRRGREATKRKERGRNRTGGEEWDEGGSLGEGREERNEGRRRKECRGPRKG